jgi:hypothetical protein
MGVWTVVARAGRAIGPMIKGLSLLTLGQVSEMSYVRVGLAAGNVN